MTVQRVSLFNIICLTWILKSCRAWCSCHITYYLPAAAIACSEGLLAARFVARTSASCSLCPSPHPIYVCSPYVPLPPLQAKDVAVSFAVSSDVVVPVHYTDVLRGEATSALLQVALEHLLHFQHRGYGGPGHFGSSV